MTEVATADHSVPA